MTHNDPEEAVVPSNPQVFPTINKWAENTYVPEDGITLRDLFAGFALVGLIAKTGLVTATVGGEPNSIRMHDAVRAYAEADAMLAARMKKSGDLP